MSSVLTLPKIYAIVDAGTFAVSSDPIKAICNFVAELIAGGAELVQYRDKLGSAPDILSRAREVRRTADNRARLIMNDRADICVAARYDGVHVGQEDLSPSGARRVTGTKPLIGISTHNLEQVEEANSSAADYIAIGPVFGTTSKVQPDPVIGLTLVTAARKITRKPLVAIGGINRQNCYSVIDAGADSVAVISDLLDSPRNRMQEFCNILG